MDNTKQMEKLLGLFDYLVEEGEYREACDVLKDLKILVDYEALKEKYNDD